ncbi:DUF3536 domain-containing protein [Desulfonatronospira sp. MSAO_Bac3]|uniref:DUF3536 domain-containing protein n=1 Tax=Desulfonatronospira sp. MSAO_Bac3 TaxID=2293857 RepID=UPI000FEEEFD3|nr:DUF3536 domain-containing protein [Desulfonatronospira sp. MSAO_Bac3]RQD73829.1 MAG: DUF3536 domain-containing protein [Desulfonatronospira sp. MSAO_Bac3]
MPQYLCIHGHFYQPPRFDPWLEEVLPEASAAPFPDWNQRINRESYDPLGAARILDEHGRIERIVNCYEFINFNFGPTILRWMARHSPSTYHKVLEGDRKSIERFGRGNAMAQIYHHIIMPLTTDEDREVEIQWSIQDFQQRFGRRPEGFWLSETAVSTPDLEALARADIRFTVLAPRQAKAISDSRGNWHEVDEGTLPKDRPYLVKLPSGREVSVFFYDGPVSQAVAFENLLSDGEGFWQRILANHDQKLLSLATDGESYGHHFKFGEMALAWVLNRALQEDSPLSLTNFSSCLDKHPPQQEVRIHEKSSWSCVHGIERWQDDCGCSSGDHPGWNQLWRRPLRRSLNVIRYYVDEHYRHYAGELFSDPRQAMLDYGNCLSGKVERDEFLRRHQARDLDRNQRAVALKFLEMQRMSLASFASCAWFFDDLGRIEPLNALSYGSRALEMLKDLQGPDVEPLVLEVLEEARSNDPAIGDGVTIWKEKVLPRRVRPAHMAVMGACMQDRESSFSFPGLEFSTRKEKNILQLDYSWTCLQEQGQKKFALDQEASLDCRVQTGEGESLGMANMDKKLQNHVLLQLDREYEEKILSTLMQAASMPGRHRESFFETGQKEPIAGRGILSLGMLIHYLSSAQEADDWSAFWQEVLQNNPYLSFLLRSCLEKELAGLCSQEQQMWDKAGEMIQRSRKLGIYPDIYHLQNRIWEKGLDLFEEHTLKMFDFRS